MTRYLQFLSAGMLMLAISTYAAEPTAALKVHLQEMQKHMVKMESMPKSDMRCVELETHMRQMTKHMGMMMEMMEAMHTNTPDHEMEHDRVDAGESNDHT